MSMDQDRWMCERCGEMDADAPGAICLRCFDEIGADTFAHVAEVAAGTARDVVADALEDLAAGDEIDLLREADAILAALAAEGFVVFKDSAEVRERVAQMLPCTGPLVKCGQYNQPDYICPTCMDIASQVIAALTTGGAA